LNNRLLAASPVAARLAAAMLTGCPTPSTGTGPNDPLPSSILTREAEASQSCPIGDVPGPLVAPERVPSVMAEHLPHFLPPQFGLAAGWGPGGATDTAGAVWTDPRCRTVRVVLDPHAEAGSGPQVGEWTLTQNATCGNGLLQDVPCLEYRADAGDAALVVSTVGLAREEGDAVISSIPLAGRS
jgi:hypothetical protein